MQHIKKRILPFVLSLVLMLPGLLTGGFPVRAETTGTTYYVSNSSGDDANTGTDMDHPWKSLKKVDGATFQPGDKVLFKAGDVWTDKDLLIKSSGTADAPILFSSYGTGNKPVINRNGGGTDAICLDNVSYVTVQGFEVSNYNASDYDDYKTAYYRRSGIWVKAYNQGTKSGVKILDNDIHDVTGISITGEVKITDTTGKSSNKNSNAGILVNQWDYDQTAAGYQPARMEDLEISGNNIHDITTVGISMDGYQTDPAMYAANVHITDNRISKTGDDGIIVGLTRNPVIERNIVEYCGINGIDHRWIAALWTFRTDGATVQYNEVSHTTYQDKSTSDSAAFDVDIDSIGNFYIQYNYSHDNTGGFLMDMGDLQNGNTVVRYNISQNDGHNGFSDTTLNLQNPNYAIYNNVFYNDTVDGFNIRENSSAVFRNNVFYVTCAADYSSSSVFQNNAFYGAAAPDQAIASLTSDPQFQNPGQSGDGIHTAAAYQLKATSPLLGAGLSIADCGTADFWGDPLYTGSPEIGAYESPTDQTADGTSPAAATGLTATDVTDTTVSLFWQAAENGVPLSADVYDVAAGKVVSSVVMASACTVTGLTPDQDYRFYVVARDKSGNAAQPSDPVTVHTCTAAVVVDDTAAQTTGAWASSSDASAYGGSYLNTPAGTGESSVIWTPALVQDGYYRVSYLLPTGTGYNAGNALFTVHYSGGEASTTVNERLATGQWTALGIHYFKAGEGSVTLTDQADGTVRADAVKFEYINGFDAQAIVSAALSFTSVQAAVGGQLTSHVLGSNSAGKTADLVEMGAAITYASDQPSVAAVSPNGVVTGLSAGTASISASVSIGGHALQTGAVKVYIGSSFLVETPVFTDAEGQTVTALEAGGKLHVATHVVNSTPGIRPVTVVAALYGLNGLAQMKSATVAIAAMDQDTVALTLALPQDVTGYSAKVMTVDSLTALHPLADAFLFPDGRLQSAALTLGAASLYQAQTAQLSLSGTCANGNAADLTDAAVTYTSSDLSVATVDANGVVTAVNAGTVDITASVTLDGATVQTNAVTVTVLHIPTQPTTPVTVTLDATPDVQAGGDAALTATVAAADGGIPSGIVQFTVDGTALGSPVLLDDTGKAVFQWTNVPGGTHVLEAQYSGDPAYTPGTSTIASYEVSKLNQAALTIGGVPQSVTYGDAPFALSVSGGSGSGALSYSVSGSAVAVDADGQVRVQGAGSAVVTVTKAGDDTYNPVSASVTVTVAKAQSHIVTPPAASGVTAPAALSAAVLTGGAGSVPGTFTWSQPDAAVTEPGSYEVTFTPADAANYLPSTGMVFVSVTARRLADDTTGVQVLLPQGALPEGVALQDIRLSVTPVTGGTAFTQAQAALASAGTKFSLFDIRLYAGDTPLEPTKPVQVSLPIPDGFDTAHLALYYIKDDGTTEPVTGGSAQGGLYVFTASHFSSYALVDTSGADTSSAPSSAASSGSISATESAGNPPTGVGTPMGAAVVVFGVAACAALLFGRRRRNGHNG